MIKRYFALLAFVSLVTLTFITVFAIYTLKNLEEIRAIRNYAMETAAHLQTLTSVIKDAESSQRGYILTGKTNYLEPYHKALKYFESPQYLSFFHSYFEPDVIEQTKELQTLIDEKLNYLRQALQQNSKENLEEIPHTVNQDLGNQIMNQIRELSLVIQEKIQEQVYICEKAVKKNIRNLFAVIILGGSFATAITAFCLYLLYQDIQKRKLIEKELLQKNQLQNTILNSFNAPMMTLDDHGRILKCNSKAEELLGYHIWEITHSSFANFLNGDDNRETIEQLNKKYEIHLYNPLSLLIYLSQHKLSLETPWIIRGKNQKPKQVILKVAPLEDEMNATEEVEPVKGFLIIFEES